MESQAEAKNEEWYQRWIPSKEAALTWAATFAGAFMWLGAMENRISQLEDKVDKQQESIEQHSKMPSAEPLKAQCAILAAQATNHESSYVRMKASEIIEKLNCDARQ